VRKNYYLQEHVQRPRGDPRAWTAQTEICMEMIGGGQQQALSTRKRGFKRGSVHLNGLSNGPGMATLTACAPPPLRGPHARDIPTENTTLQEGPEAD